MRVFKVSLAEIEFNKCFEVLNGTFGISALHAIKGLF